MILINVGLALSALLRNRVRSLLTMLGIVIGVAAVVMMQSMGRGATAYVTKVVSGLGSNMLTIIPGAVRGFEHSEFGVPRFNAGDMDAIRRRAPSVRLVSAAGTAIKRVVHGPYSRSTTIIGVQSAFFTIREWQVAEGRLLTDQDDQRSANVCTVGRTVSEGLFPEGSPLDREVRIGRTTCRVVGVMNRKGTMFGQDLDDIVIMPYATFSRRIIGSDRIAALVLAATSEEHLDQASRELRSILRSRRHLAAGEDDDFAIRDPREMQVVLGSVTAMLTTLLAGVAAISLVVGGIGIMNIMLVSVTERTREIGVRLAIGARSSDILLQFLVEAITLSMVGGLIGVGTGLLGARAIARGIGVPFVVPTAAMALAFLVSIAVGVTFGVIPARKAARLHPLAALRYE